MKTSTTYSPEVRDRLIRAVMTEASQMVLDGFSVRSEAHVIRAPERFIEAADVTMWNRLMQVLGCDDACVAEGD